MATNADYKRYITELTLDYLKHALSYDSETGIFTWKNPVFYKFKPGDIANRVNKMKRDKVYIAIKLCGKDYLAHRLAWFWVTGKWPAGEVDHWDGNSLNNRFTNLRDATHSINSQNRVKPGKNNTSGYLGVSWDTTRGKYKAAIKFQGESFALGYFDDPEKAHQVYLENKRIMHEGCTI